MQKPTRKRTYQDQYRLDNRDKLLEYNRRVYRELKEETLKAYGLVCATCGFSDQRALQIDHIENDGAVERKRLGGRCFSGYPFYRWLKKQGWPSGYQTLCANCNSIKRSVFSYGPVGEPGVPATLSR